MTKCLSLLNYIDHPKDLIYLSSYFSKFFENYFRANLFPQTLNLLSSTTDKDCMLEVTKAFCYFYNALKFRNHVFDFRTLLIKEKVIGQLLGKEMVRDIASLASRTEEEIMQACVIMLINVVKYAGPNPRYSDAELGFLDDGELLSQIFSKLDSPLSPDNISGLALLAYSLSLRQGQLNDGLAKVQPGLTRRYS